MAVSESMIYVGIDPGANGAIVFGSSEDRTLAIYKMPETEAETWNVFKNFRLPRLHPIVAVIERVGGYVQGKDFVAGSSAMFNFGMGYGRLLMALTAAEIPYSQVTPQKWQKALGISPRIGKGETDTQFKNRLRDVAQQIYPYNKVTLQIADALLLLEYCRKSIDGGLHHDTDRKPPRRRVRGGQ